MELTIVVTWTIIAVMSKNTVSLAIPETLAEYIDQRVAAGGYGNRSEYFRDLVRQDQREQAKARLRALVEEGLTSGPPIPLTKADWAELRDIASGKIR
jgi:antitoxin ParD1/3/4